MQRKREGGMARAGGRGRGRRGKRGGTCFDWAQWLTRAGSTSEARAPATGTGTGTGTGTRSITRQDRPQASASLRLGGNLQHGSRDESTPAHMACSSCYCCHARRHDDMLEAGKVRRLFDDLAAVGGMQARFSRREPHARMLHAPCSMLHAPCSLMDRSLPRRALRANAVRRVVTVARQAQPGEGEEVVDMQACDIWPPWARPTGLRLLPRLVADEGAAAADQTASRQDMCCCWRPWARADVVGRCSAARNTTMPCSMAAQAPADPPWAIRNYGGQGICSPTLTRSEIGYFASTWSLTLPAHRPHMSATRQHALALVRPAAATPTAQAPTIVLSSSFNTLAEPISSLRRRGLGNSSFWP
ncbi:hypothetical protein COCMIDRAFT_30145 [Bipolaris oryzae ATCC 44560]|uniref:Uncharacterized protein n=1 Tax=Bipolaris oryzae ATCC 44560 TaxID=930090 RepID=W6YZP0_COCMI|nr:uncharacterized protein COCMIDRAFT_30145 [Bipolaris oryzae ATCC 44560]EUC41004.1 hypothetical protein COCMIDRAFT_30145 [Bipolaris oryzae ATCC 44560]